MQSRSASTGAGSVLMSCSLHRRPARSRSTRSAANQPGVTNTGTPFASFLLGQVQLFSIDLQQSTIQERARIPGVLHPG